MTEAIVTMNCDDTAEAAAKLMTGNPWNYVLILEKSQPIGIVTEHDLITKILATGRTRKTPTHLIMSSPLITIDPDDDLMKACALMKRFNIKKLPVVRAGIIYGILTANDIVTKINSYVDKSNHDLLRYNYWFT